MATFPKILSKRENELAIISDNIFYNNGILTAYYIMPMTNYDVASNEGIFNSINSLTQMIKNLASSRPELEFSIETISKTVKVTDVRNNLKETIKLYNPEFEMPEDFSNRLMPDEQEYCILGVKLDAYEMQEAEEYTLKEISKNILEARKNSLLGATLDSLNYKQILEVEQLIYNAIKETCMRVTKDLLFYIYVSKLYPSYNISWDKLSYINENHYSQILGVLSQSISDQFGSFELHNEGVDIFGLPNLTTYGCMLEIKQFPKTINMTNFPLFFPNSKITVKCMKKDDATIKLKRLRASSTYEGEEAAKAEMESEEMQNITNAIALATHALQELKEEDAVFCEFNYEVLVASQTKKDLNKAVNNYIRVCKDKDILMRRSLMQATTYINEFLNNNPKDYDNFTSIQFPLSFQMNNGAIVGDSKDNSAFYSPAIGEAIV